MPYPRSIQLELVTQCNFRCPLCRSGQGQVNGPKEMTLSQITALVDALEEPPELWNLYGKVGEPLLHPELPEIIRTVASKGPTSIRISTNGSLLNGDLAKALLDTPLDRLIIAFDGATQESYQKYRRGGNFTLLCKNIEDFASLKRSLGQKKPRLSAQFIPMRHNEDEFEAVLSLAESLGFNELRVKLSGSVCRCEELRPRRPEFIVPPSGQKRPSCKIDEWYIDCRGRVFPCCHLAAWADIPGGKELLLGKLETDSKGKSELLLDGLDEFRQIMKAKKLPKPCRRHCTNRHNKIIRKIRFYQK